MESVESHLVVQIALRDVRNERSKDDYSGHHIVIKRSLVDRVGQLGKLLVTQRLSVVVTTATPVLQLENQSDLREARSTTWLQIEVSRILASFPVAAWCLRPSS